MPMLMMMMIAHYHKYPYSKFYSNMFNDHIKQDIFLAFQTSGYLLLHESSAESSPMNFLQYFHSAISNHLSIAMSMSPEYMVA